MPYVDLAKTIAYSGHVEEFLDLCVASVNTQDVVDLDASAVGVIVCDRAERNPVLYNHVRAAMLHVTGRDLGEKSLLVALTEAVIERAGPDEGRARRLEEIARQCVMPHPSSPQNMEVIAMSLNVFMRALKTCGWPDLRNENVPVARRVAANMAYLLECFDERDVSDAILFLNRWHESVFARLEVSHKLAAAFCLTDIVDSDDIRAPWLAWSLLVPNGLFGEDGPARIWCLGKRPIVLVFPARDGKGAGLASWAETDRRSPVNAGMVTSLVLSTCIALNNPERERVQKTGSWGVQSKTPRRTGAPPEGTRYVLAQPVSIDLRETVLEAMGKRSRVGGSPKAQFLVRGHWRNQAHGPGRSMRTLKWIEPFWKGPEDARILLRSHKVKKEDDSK